MRLADNAVYGRFKEWGSEYGAESCDAEGDIWEVGRVYIWRQKINSNKINYAKFLTYFIETYPQSVDAVRMADKSFWEKFK